MKRPLLILALLTVAFTSAIVLVAKLTERPTSPLLQMSPEAMRMYMQSPDNGYYKLAEAAVSIKKSTVESRLSRKQWLLSPCDSPELPAMREFLAGHEEAITLTREALDHPYFVMPSLLHYDLIETYHTSNYQLAMRLIDIGHIHACDGDTEAPAALYHDTLRIGIAMLHGARINEGSISFSIQARTLEPLGKMLPILDEETLQELVDTTQNAVETMPTFEYFFEHTMAWEDKYVNFGIVHTIRARWSTPYYAKQFQIERDQHIAQLKTFLAAVEVELDRRAATSPE